MGQTNIPQDMMREMEAIWAVEQTSELVFFFDIFEKWVKTQKHIYNL